MGSINKCDWCGAETTNKEMYTAMSPLIEKYEKLIKKWDKKYGQFWMDNVDGEIDQKLLDEVILYDQATNTVGKGIICDHCLEKDEMLYQKYRLITTNKDIDPYNMLKIIVDEEKNTIDDMEEWYLDIKNKQSSLDK
jgi:hypothetical protein